MGRKGENIYKRKDGRWEGRYIKYKIAGEKTKYGYVYASSYREVKNKLASAICTKQTEAAEKWQKKSVPFQTAAEEWQENIRPKIKESTAVKYRNLLNSYIFPEFGAKFLENITQENLESHCNRLLLHGGQKGNGLSPKTVSDVLSLMRNILRYAADKGYACPHDIKTVSIRQNTHSIRVLSRIEQKTLCQCLYQNISDLNLGILLCLFTGLRLGEICALKWEDISFSEKTVCVHRTMQRLQTESHQKKRTEIIISKPKSSCSMRTIPLSDELIFLLSGFKGSHKGFLLTGKEDQFIEPRALQRHFQRVLKESSLEPVNYHVLRHTFATRCIEVGFDVKSLSEILGHANVSITMNRYVHPSMDLKRENMQRLSPLFTVKENRQNKENAAAEPDMPVFS